MTFREELQREMISACERYKSDLTGIKMLKDVLDAEKVSEIEKEMDKVIKLMEQIIKAHGGSMLQ